MKNIVILFTFLFLLSCSNEDTSNKINKDDELINEIIEEFNKENVDNTDNDIYNEEIQKDLQNDLENLFNDVFNYIEAND